MSEAKMATDTDPQRTDDSSQPVAAAPKKEESWIETVKTVVYALLIALVIRTFLFQPFNIPSSSMENTLLVGDYLFVEKFAYGFSRYSLPYGKEFPSVGRIFGSSPARGDVVVFKMPNPESADYGEDFIKRVMGLPGDRVQMLDGQVYINGKAVPKTRVADFVETDEFGMTNHVARYRETLPSGKSYYVLDRIQNGQADNTPVFTVPAGHYFMMGEPGQFQRQPRRCGLRPGGEPCWQGGSAILLYEWHCALVGNLEMAVDRPVQPDRHDH
jgi:signal peptidase I